MYAPERSLTQRMDALQKANVIRSKRAAMKVEMGSGELEIGQLLEMVDEPPEWLESMKVYDLLVAFPGVGDMKVRAFLRREVISASKTVTGISKRQRRMVLLFLQVREPSRQRYIATNRQRRLANEHRHSVAS